MNALNGRSSLAALVVLTALLTVVDVASRALAPWLSRVREAFGLWRLLGPSPSARVGWSALFWPVLLALGFYAALTADANAGILFGAVMARGAFSDLLDPRFREVIADRSAFLRAEDMVPVLWNIKPPTMPQRDTERYSQVSGLARAGQFTGSLDYAQRYQGYDVTATYAEFAQGVQVERTLVEYDQFELMDDMARDLADSMWRRRQFDAFRFLRNMFSVDTFFYNHTEGVALCSDNHTTTTGASTATGFDNLATSAFSAAMLAASQIQMRDFRDLQGEPIMAVGTEIWVPFDLYEQAYEVVASSGKVDSAQNNRNVHQGAYKLVVFPNKVDFTSTANWALVDGRAKDAAMHWFDQVWPNGGPEFGSTEEFDTFVSKHRGYMRYTNIIRRWQWMMGSQVS